jgi:hypothetical protein
MSETGCFSSIALELCFRICHQEVLELNGTHQQLAYAEEGVSKSSRTGLLQRELQIVQLSATKCSCIAIL